MKRKFTILTAALALLACLAIPLGMWGQQTSTLTFTAACGGSGTADDDAEWTVTSDGTESNFDNTRGIHYGTNSAQVQYIQLSTSDISGTITKVVVNASKASGVTATVGVTVGGSTFGGNPQSLSTSATNYTFEGSASGEIVVLITKPEKATKALYCKSIAVTYTTGGTPTYYTVTFNAGDGTFVGNTDFPSTTNQKEAGTYALPSATRSGFTFNGWTTTGNNTPQTGNYTVSGNVDFTASYTENGGGSGNITATLTQSNLELTGSYTTDTEKTIDGVTYVYSRLMKSNDNIQAEANNGTIKNTTPYPGIITSVAITHYGTARATTINGSANGTDWTEVATGSGSITADFSGLGYRYFQITRGSNAAYWTKIEITYALIPTISASAGSDLAYDATEGSIVYEIQNYEEGTMVASTEASWITNFTYEPEDEMGEVSFTVATNTGGPRQATVTLTYTYGDNQTATTDVVVKQKGVPAITVTPATVEVNSALSENHLAIGLESLTIGQASDLGVQFYDEDNQELNGTNAPNWINASVEAVEGSTGYRVHYIVDENAGAARTAYFKVYAMDDETNLVYSNLVTISQDIVPLFIGADPSTIEVGYQGNDNGGFEVLFDERLQSPYGSSVVLCFYDENDNQINDPEWFQYQYYQEHLSFEYTISKNTSTEPRTARMKIKYTDPYTTATIFSDYILISQEAYVTPVSWVLTSIEDLTESDIFVIVGDNGDTYAMSNGNGTTSAPDAVEVTVTEGTLSGEPAANLQWTISGNATDGYTFYPNGSTENWLYCTNTNNGVRVGTNSNNKVFTIEDGYLYNSATSRYVGIYNSQDWRCYTSHVTSGNQQNNIEGQTFAFYKKVEPPTLTIEPDQWYLISSPVGTINLGTSQQPTNNVGNLTTGTYGLYSFDQTGGTDGKEWRNYKAGAFSQLEEGTGYLYINQGGCTLTFTGTPYTGTGTFQLVYSNSANITESFRGLNLVGNPYAQSAAIDRNYYIMNANGTDLTAYTSDDIVPAMQGVFVKATEEGQNVTFTPNQSTTGGKGIEINLSQNRGTIVDRAIVRFGEGSQLSKVQLFENSTKLYIPQNGKDYAIVSTEAQGELPVNFRASENGTYTLSMDVENMDMNYLHLIDNMTGMDIDLLQTPSYTFEAKVNDYESRFRLVFAANNEDGVSTGSTAFAFYSNGSWIINNAGEATLQVVDLTGRILSSETVNGSVSKTINAVPGVYMLRLINGDNVNVQKIVVR